MELVLSNDAPVGDGGDAASAVIAPAGATRNEKMQLESRSLVVDLGGVGRGKNRIPGPGASLLWCLEILAPRSGGWCPSAAGGTGS